MKRKAKKKTQKSGNLPDGLQFRVRKFKDLEMSLNHPDPIPGHKSTLPGPPGWQSKERPGA